MKRTLIINLFLTFVLTLSSCKSKEPCCVFSFACLTNIENSEDIEFLIRKRLVVKDSIDFDLSIKNKEGIIKFYSAVDTILFKRILVNQIDDGCYRIFNSQDLYHELLQVNDSLGLIREKLIDNLHKKLHTDKSTLIGEMNISNDSIELEELKDRKLNPLFMLLLPSADYMYGSKKVSKSIGCFSIDSICKVEGMLSKSSYIPRNTKLLYGNIAFERFVRKMYVVNCTDYKPIDSTDLGTTLNRVNVYNNTVQTTFQEIEKSSQRKFASFDLTENDVNKYLELMMSKKYLKIEAVKINAR